MTDQTAKKHATLSPSGYSRWSQCPGSIELEKPFPNNSNVHSMYGTAMHHLAEVCLAKRPYTDAEEHIGRAFGDPGEEVVADMEMADAVNSYISYLGTFIDEDAGDTLLVEVSVPLAHLTGEEGATGTSDAVGISADGKTLTVADLKGGKGVRVDAKDNGQLRMYALGALFELGSMCLDVETVKLVIIQPRIGHVDMEELSIGELRAFGEEVAIAAGRTQIGNAELVPGEKQCRFCRAKAVCPALRAEVLTAVTVSDGSSFANLDDTTLPKKLAAEIVTPDNAQAVADAMRAAPLVETWLKAVRAEGERLLFAGEHLPGFKLVEGKRGSRAWRDEDEALTELRKRATLDKIVKKEPISPTQAEKLFKDKPRVWSKLCELIVQADGKPSVAPESDPRPPISLVSEASSFEALPPATELGVVPLAVSHPEYVMNTEENIALRFEMTKEKLGLTVAEPQPIKVELSSLLD